MSYSLDAKKEITRVKYALPCCDTARLCALVLSSGSIVLRGAGRFELMLVTSENSVAQLIVALLKKEAKIPFDIKVTNVSKLQKAKKYCIRLSDPIEARRILMKLGILSCGESGMSIDRTSWERLFKCDDCFKAFLGGVFCACGSIINPEHSNHMEFSLAYEDFATCFSDVLNSRGINCKVHERKNRYMVYIKDAESIIDVLRATGASDALFGYENIRIKKEIVNRVNRLMNCDMANQNKTMDAADKDTACIEYIVTNKGWDYFPKSLIEIAKLRLENPDVSLASLGTLLSDPIGKSGVNHRLRKIRQLAAEVAQETEDDTF